MKTNLLALTLVSCAWTANADEMGATYFDPSLNYSQSSATIESRDLERDMPNEVAAASTDRLILKFGPGWSSISNAGTDGTASSRNTYFVAAEFERAITPEFSVVTGLNLMEKGMDYPSSKAAVSMSYLMVPLLAQFNFQINPKQKLSLAVGPYWAYALSQGMVYEETGYIQNGSSAASSWDFGTRVKADYDILIKDGFSFLVGAGYDLGLANVRPTSSGSQNTRAFMASIGLGMRI